jgi:hypothetical protein
MRSQKRRSEVAIRDIVPVAGRAVRGDPAAASLEVLREMIRGFGQFETLPAQMRAIHPLQSAGGHHEIYAGMISRILACETARAASHRQNASGTSNDLESRRFKSLIRTQTPILCPK